MDKNTKQNYIALAFVFTIFIALLFFANYTFAKNQSGGTDFLYRWLPTRLVFFEGYENPYSDEVEYQVELVHHGHAHQKDETPGIFAYPYYTMIVFFPFALTENFLSARAAWMTLMEIAHIAIIVLSLKITGYKPTKSILIALIFFSLFSAEFLQALIDGNPSSLSAFFAILSLFFISQKADRRAGFFLALSTIKPQLVILFFILIWLWAFFKKRWEIISSSLITLTILLGTSFLLQPSWFAEFFKDITTYTGIASPSTPRAILGYWMPTPYANIIAWGLTILSIFALYRIWKYAFQGNFSALLWASSFTFVIMPFTGITSAKSNYIAMLPMVILLLQYGYKRISHAGFWFALFLWLWIILSWVFFYAGKNWTINNTLIYFVDFYPMPILLLGLFYLLRPFNEEPIYEHRIAN